MPSSDPTDDQLKVRFDRLLPFAAPFAGTVYRSSTPKYATEDDLLTGEGARRSGGRWNPPGIGVVYASLSPQTAMAETLAHFRYYGLPIQDAMPRTFVAIKADLQNVLDLRDGRLRQRLRVSIDRVLSVDWRKEARRGQEPITQRLGRAAFDTGLEGLIVPSSADADGHNLLIFPGQFRKGSRLEVLNPDSL